MSFDFDDTISIVTDTGELITIRELNPDMIEPCLKQAKQNIADPFKKTQGGSKITVIGKPCTGKTGVIMRLLYEKRGIFHSGMVLSETEDVSPSYSNHFPPLFVYNELNTDAVKHYIERQKLLKKHVGYAWGVLVFDDCTQDRKILQTPLFQGIFKFGRHWSTMFIFALQYCLDLGPSLRGSIDWVFIMREDGANERKKIYENLASIIPTYELFTTIMNAVTGDYTALVIKKMSQTNDWRECIFWYRSSNTLPEKWKFGSQYYWDFSNQRYDPEFDSTARFF